MAEKPTYEELEHRVLCMGKELQRLAHLEGINNALYRIANAINMTAELDELFKIIHAALSPIIDTTNFYISLYDRVSDSLSFPYIVDTVDLCYPPVIEVSKTASLTAEVIRSKRPLLTTKAEILARREKSNLSIPACTPAEIWLGVPLKNQEEIIGVMAVQNYQDPHCYDDTDINILVAVADQVAIVLQRKQAEKALRQSEEKFRHIITTVREGILSLDADWRITFANAHLAEMFGYDLEGLLGKPFELFLHEEDLQDFEQRKNERQQGMYSQFERRFKTKEGREIWTIVSATALKDSQGSFAGSFGTITDITERKQAEKALREKVDELRQAADQIKTLRGIVPICMHCKKIRDDKGFWNQVEVYVRKHTEAEFSHGVCPDCVKLLYPDYQ